MFYIISVRACFISLSQPKVIQMRYATQWSSCVEEDSKSKRASDNLFVFILIWTEGVNVEIAAWISIRSA